MHGVVIGVRVRVRVTSRVRVRVRVRVRIRAIKPSGGGQSMQKGSWVKRMRRDPG